MSRQKPKLTPQQALRAWEKERHGTQGGPAWPLASPIVRQRVFKGETKAQAKARWEREREIEQDRLNDQRIDTVTGRIAPVFYE